MNSREELENHKQGELHQNKVKVNEVQASIEADTRLGNSVLQEDLELLESRQKALALTIGNLNDNFETNTEDSPIRAHTDVIVLPDRERLNELLKTMSSEVDKKQREKIDNPQKSEGKKNYCEICKLETGSEDNMITHKRGKAHCRKVNDSQMSAKYFEAPMVKSKQKPKKK